ncbi:MAG: hypothetical protein QQW96_07075 [Tychonema bourrellyi B0820]|nr:hypothetical protein [Tychonema bourrellyi]MDQ2097391.1 hypothetical protein [Tychonema bourrellyi B0820]
MVIGNWELGIGNQLSVNSYQSTVNSEQSTVKITDEQTYRFV